MMNETNNLVSHKPFWIPNRSESIKVHKLIDHINKIYNLKIDNYQNLHKWSIENISLFWETFLVFSEIKYYGKFTRAVDESVSMEDIPIWFEGCKLNYAQNLLHPCSDNIAVVSENEYGQRLQITHRELYREVGRITKQFRRFGLVQGDIVASILPNDHRALICMLACTSIGCIWTAIPPELQAKGVCQKLCGIQPRILLAANETKYGGKIFDQISKLHEISKELNYLDSIIVFTSEPNIKINSNKLITTNWDFAKKYGEDDDDKTEIEFEKLDFKAPLFILYTSGTTGPSKKLVHSVGGTLIKVVMEHIINGNLDSSDVVFYNTSPGWIMWNWVVTSLFAGGTLLLYDGSPIKPDPFVLWEFCHRNNATVFGSGAAYYYLLQQNNIKPNSMYDLKCLKYFLSTGSHLPKSSYCYINDCIKSGIPICSLAGATDIISCFAGHNLSLPVYPGQIQYPNLGMHVLSYDDKGNHVYDTFGELVCVKPFPSMPVYFMNDTDNKRYRETYFSRFKNVWTHGDLCYICSKSGGLTISGRSDSTLNVNGVRIGTAEIYNIVEQLPEVLDTLCVTQILDEATERMILFVSYDPKNDFELVVEKIKSEIRNCLSPRHMPSLILPAPEIPYTITGKKVEILVKKIISGLPYSINHESLQKPDLLQYFINLKL